MPRERQRAAVLHGVGDVRIEERPVPEPGPREVLVQVSAVGVCGSDVHYFEHGRIGSFVVEAPLVLGHEVAGVVAAVGDRAGRHAVGDRVTLEPGVPCGACRECRAGRYNLCADVVFFATPPVDGAFADFVTIHEDFAYALPDGVSDVAGALIEPLSCGLWACQRGGVTAGDRVLVTGAGPIGLLTQQAALACGATEVTVTDVNADRLALAERTGATRTLDVSQEPLAGVEVDVLIECSGNPAALRDGIRCVRPGGAVVAVGMGPDEETPIPLAYVQTHELRLTGTFRYAGTWPTAIALVASGRVDLDAIVTGSYGLDATEQALRAGREDPATAKVVVLPGR